MSLKNQVVLVTGSSGGIGDAAVSALTASGAIVIGADRSPKEDQSLEAFHPLDITSEQQCATVIQDIQAKYGRLDVLVHAAGVLGPTPDIMETSTEEFDSIL